MHTKSRTTTILECSGLVLLFALSSCGSDSLTPDAGNNDASHPDGPGGRGGAAGGVAGAGGRGGGAGGMHGDVAGVGGAGGVAVGCQAGTAGGEAAVAGLPDNIVFLSNVVVTTLTGGPNAGAEDGAPAVATFDNPVGVTIEPTGALVVSTFDDSKLRRISTDGVTSTLTDQASFIRPYGIGALGGMLYVETDADPVSGAHGPQNGTMWRVDPSTGAATVVKANTGKPRSFAPLGRPAGGQRREQREGLDPRPCHRRGRRSRRSSGLPWFCRRNRHRGPLRISERDRRTRRGSNHRRRSGAHVLREVTVTGVVTTFAGDGGAGAIDGPMRSARFMGPRGLASDASGAVYVSDDVDHRIRRIDADGIVTTLAGTGTAGFADGPGNLAQFYGQEGIAVTADGRTVYVADGTGGSETPVHTSASVRSRSRRSRWHRTTVPDAVPDRLLHVARQDARCADRRRRPGVLGVLQAVLITARRGTQWGCRRAGRQPAGRAWVGCATGRSRRPQRARR